MATPHPVHTAKTASPAPPAERILAMCTGNWLSRVLAVATRRDLFTACRDGLTLARVGDVLGAPERPARMMADVLVAAGLLDRHRVNGEERFTSSELAVAYLVPGAPHYLGDTVLMFDDRLYHTWERLEEALHEDRPVVETYAEAPPTLEEAARLVRSAIQGLHGLTTLAAEALDDSLDLSTCRHALDLGGGSGALAITLARRHPDLQVTAVDRAPILAVIRDNVAAADAAMNSGRTRSKKATRKALTGRIHLLEADFFCDPLPGDRDLVTLSNILHDWSRPQGEALIRRAWDALRPGGRVVVNEWLLDDDRRGPLLSALLSLCMLLETTAGENLSGREIAAVLERCGFANVQVLPTCYPHGIVTGLKP